MRSTPLARLIATAIVLGANVLGLFAVFADLGPSEPVWLRIVLTVGLFMFAGTLFGALVPKAWYLAVLACISPMMFGAFAMSMRLRVGGPPPYWTFIVVALFAPPFLALVGAYVGSRLRRNVGVAGSDAF